MTPDPKLNKLVTRWSAWAAFLLPALSLTVPSGYSWGALALCIAGLFAKFASPHSVTYTPSIRAFVIASMALGLVFMSGIIGTAGWDWRGMDRPVKFLLVAVAAWALWERHPPENRIKWGIWLGAIGAALTAAWQVLINHQERAEGYTNAIHFGGLSLLLAIWSFIWATQSNGKAKWVGYLGGAMGATACLLSESRGSWVVAPALFAVWWYVRTEQTARAPRWHLWILTATLTLLVVTQWPMLKSRYTAAVLEATAYVSGKDLNEASMTSVGQRLAHWRFALQIGSEKPWVGWGDEGYKREKQRRVAGGEAPVGIAGFGHAHNDWMEMWGKYGSVGVLALLLVLLIPAHKYWRVLRATPPPRHSAIRDTGRTFALCGLMLVLGYFGFGQTQVMFAHNSGTIMYLFMNLLFLAGCQDALKAKSP